VSSNDDTILVRLKLQNGSQFKAELAGASSGVSHFGNQVHAAGKKTEFARVETFAWRQGLYTLRRELFYGTAAAGAFAIGAFKLGLTFDETERSGTAFFTSVLGSATLARREMSDLTNVTHQTGLQLTTITEGAKRMQGFGFATQEASKDLRILGNYAQRAGLGTGGFDSLVNVFDRIKQSGTFGRRDLLTLTSMGIPALQILRRELGLTADQYTALQKGKLTIPSRFALPALAAGLDQRANQLGTGISQQVGISHSFLSQIFGTGEKGLFGFATKGLERVNKALARAATGQQTGGTKGLLLGLDPSGKLLNGWQTLSSLMRGAGEAIIFVWRVTLPLRWALGGVGFILGDVAKHTSALNWLMKALAFWYVTTRTKMLLFAGAEKLVAYWTGIVTAAQGLQLRAMYLLDGEFATAIGLTTALRTQLMLLGGIGLITIGVELVIHRQGIQDWLSKKFGWAGQTAGASLFMYQTLWDKINGNSKPKRKVPGAASGANVIGGGSIMVGEDGPELLHVPAGARVQPLKGGMGSLGAMLQPIIEVYFDSAMVARQLAENRQSRKALGEANATYRAEVGAHA
jgi:uncharacterized integral membrane protein